MGDIRDARFHAKKPVAYFPSARCRGAKAPGDSPTQPRASAEGIGDFPNGQHRTETAVGDIPNGRFGGKAGAGSGYFGSASDFFLAPPT